MRIGLSPATFSISFCASYVALFFAGKPLFRYYPVAHQWAWGAADGITRPGPTMVWYGLLAGATLIATLAAMVIRDQWLMALFRGWLWVWPAAAICVCFFLLRALFL